MQNMSPRPFNTTFCLLRFNWKRKKKQMQGLFCVHPLLYVKDKIRVCVGMKYVN